MKQGSGPLGSQRYGVCIAWWSWGALKPHQNDKAILYLRTLILPHFPCLALREMASSGIYKLDDGKPYLNNCFPAKNLLRMPEQGQVTSQIGTFALPQLLLQNVSYPFLFLQPLDYCSLPHPIPSLPVHLPPAALGSLLKHISDHCVPFCSVTFHCWLF